MKQNVKNILNTLVIAIIVVVLVVFDIWFMPLSTFPYMTIQGEVQVDGVKGRWGGLLGGSDSVLDSTLDSLETISMENGEEIVLTWFSAKMCNEVNLEMYRLPEDASGTLKTITSDPAAEQIETELELTDTQANLSVSEELEPGTYLVVVNSQWSRLFYTKWGWGSYAFLAEVS